VFVKHARAKQLIVIVMVGSFLLVSNTTIFATDDSTEITVSSPLQFAEENVGTIMAIVAEYNYPDNLPSANNEASLDASAPLWFALWVLFLTACATWAAIQAAWNWFESQAGPSSGDGEPPCLPYEHTYDE
jgi:hypothetical protein